jgi:hypothetical protein
LRRLFARQAKESANLCYGDFSPARLSVPVDPFAKSELLY